MHRESQRAETAFDYRRSRADLHLAVVESPARRALVADRAAATLALLKCRRNKGTSAKNPG